jgi:hypothetical protein
VGSLVVVITAPCRDQAASMSQGIKDVLIQAFVPEAPVEAFHNAILHRFFGGNAMLLDLAVLLPFVVRIGSKLRAFVTDNHIRQPSYPCDLIQVPGTPHPGE